MTPRFHLRNNHSERPHSFTLTGDIVAFTQDAAAFGRAKPVRSGVLSLFPAPKFNTILYSPVEGIDLEIPIAKTDPEVFLSKYNAALAEHAKQLQEAAIKTVIRAIPKVLPQFEVGSSLSQGLDLQVEGYKQLLNAFWAKAIAFGKQGVKGEQDDGYYDYLDAEGALVVTLGVQDNTAASSAIDALGKQALAYGSIAPEPVNIAALKPAPDPVLAITSPALAGGGLNLSAMSFTVPTTTPTAAVESVPKPTPAPIPSSAPAAAASAEPKLPIDDGPIDLDLVLGLKPTPATTAAETAGDRVAPATGAGTRTQSTGGK